MPSTDIYTLSLHDVLPILSGLWRNRYAQIDRRPCGFGGVQFRTGPVFRCRSEEQTSELQSLRHLVCRLPISTLFPYTTFFRSYLACGATDMRKSIDGLAALVEYSFALDPFSDADRKSRRLNSSHLGISYAVYRYLHSFPTRRSSDLIWPVAQPICANRSTALRLWWSTVSHWTRFPM